MIIYQWSQVSQLIRFKIDVFDAREEFADDPEAEKEDSRPNTMKQGSSFKCGHIVLGAVQKQSSFEQVSAAHMDDSAFSHFYHKFRHFLQTQYNSKFVDLETVLSQKFQVRFHNLSTWLHLNAKLYRYLNIATLRSPSLQKSLGRLKLTISAVIQISITSHATTTYLFLHQTASFLPSSYLYSPMPRKIGLTHGY
jgi:hypothetical protein